MKLRILAVAAALLGLYVVMAIGGCSQTPPSPSVDNTNVDAKKSLDATLGLETTVTIGQLAEQLEASGLKVATSPTEGSGVFLPAEYVPLTADGAFLQTYRFSTAREAKAAAKTVENDGYVLAATPNQYINVNWTGWPAFFRSGDLVVIFVTEKGTKNAARDKRVYAALEGVFGSPFIGGNTPPPSQHATATPAGSGTSSATSQPGDAGASD